MSVISKAASLLGVAEGECGCGTFVGEGCWMVVMGIALELHLFHSFIQ